MSVVDKSYATISRVATTFTHDKYAVWPPLYFSPTAKAQVEINYTLGGKARKANFAQSDQKLADQLNNSPEFAKQFGMESGNISSRDIKKYREINKLTWHELNDVKTM